MRCGNPCAFCGLNLENGTKRVIVVQQLYHGLACVIYFMLLILMVQKFQVNSEDSFFEKYWQETILTVLHFLQISSVLVLYFGVKYANPSLLLSWIVSGWVFVIAQFLCLVVGKAGFLAQIPLLLIDIYCLWVGSAYRCYILYIRETRDDIPMMPLVTTNNNYRSGSELQDRVDGERPEISKTNSSEQRFGYCVQFYSPSGYARIPKVAIDMTCEHGRWPAANTSYYRHCFYCPKVPQEFNREQHVGGGGGGLSSLLALPTSPRHSTVSSVQAEPPTTSRFQEMEASSENTINNEAEAAIAVESLTPPSDGTYYSGMFLTRFKEGLQGVTKGLVTTLTNFYDP